MAWYNDSGDFWNLLGDPGGYITGQNTEGFGGIKKMLGGDPDAVKKSYDDMMAMAKQMTGETRDFLAKSKQQSLAQFAPLQHMFQSTYGTEGLMPQQSTRGPLAGMYGGR